MAPSQNPQSGQYPQQGQNQYPGQQPGSPTGQFGAQNPNVNRTGPVGSGPGGYYQPQGGPNRGVQPPFIPRKNATWPYWGGGIAAVLLLILLGLGATGVLGKLMGLGNPGLAANGGTSTPNLKVEGSIATPQLGAARKGPPQMPADIYNWLKHLQRCEATKVQLTNDEQTNFEVILAQVQGADGLTSAADVDRMTDPDTTLQHPPASHRINQSVQKMVADWSNLQKRFESWPVPQACMPIANNYDTGLGQTQATVADITQILNDINTTSPNLQTDIKKAVQSEKDIGSQSTHTIDDSFSEADTLVQKICDQYSVKKWFSIDAHGNSGDSLLSKLGM